MSRADEPPPEPPNWTPAKGQSGNRMRELQKYLRCEDTLEEVLRPRAKVAGAKAK